MEEYLQCGGVGAWGVWLGSGLGVGVSPAVLHVSVMVCKASSTLALSTFTKGKTKGIEAR